ncbi:MobQ family relaxase [Clostridium sp.]|uniref:MobQ family relaxase n=1 Tax=Clostridium sp. TaxID=1506 RepID=UPI002FC649E4
MAIYHCSTKIVSRGSGRSAVGASAYRSGEKLINEYDGMKHDYRKKQGIVHKEILTPEYAPNWSKNREKLWNEVEKVEKSKNSQLSREVEVALPKEFSISENIELVRNYVKDNFVNEGMVADICIHDKADGNPHAHIMLTMRPFNRDGSWGAKAKKEYILDKEGKKIKLKSGNYKSRKINTTNWDSKEKLESYRRDWADKINKVLESKGMEQRVDHRSYEEQGIHRMPTKHEGYVVRAMESRGIETEIGNINREIKKLNKELIKIDKEIKDSLVQGVIESPGEDIEIKKNKYKELTGLYSRLNRELVKNLEVLKKVETIKNKLESNEKAIAELKQELSNTSFIQFKKKKEIQKEIEGLEVTRAELKSSFGVENTGDVDKLIDKIKDTNSNYTDKLLKLKQKELKLEQEIKVKKEQSKLADKKDRGSIKRSYKGFDR